MNLCVFSKSDVLRHQILPTCPLALNATQAKKCPCRKRAYLTTPMELRVLSCTFPETWHGELIRDPEALTVKLTANSKQQKPKSTQSKRSDDVPAATQGKTTAQTVPQPVTNLPAVRKPFPVAPALAKLPLPAQHAALREIGMDIYRSGACGCKCPQQGFLYACRTGGDLTMLHRIAEVYHLLDGKFAMKAEAQLARFESTIPGGRYEIIERSPEAAEIELRCDLRKPYRLRFTWQDAQQEDIWTKEANANHKLRYTADGKVNRKALKDNWDTDHNVRRMLWWRVVTDAVHCYAPGINTGGGFAEANEGGWTDITMDDVIDAEFTVVDDGPAGPIEPKAVEEGDAEPLTDGQGEVIEQTEEHPPADVTPETTPSSAKDLLADAVNDPEYKARYKVLIKELVAIKTELKFPDDKWAAEMQKRGVASAKELSNTALDDLVKRLRFMLEKKKNKPVEDWANRKTGGEGSGGSAGN